ncbi:MAG: DUF1294 domain-containing protein [bacterium]
MFLYFLIYLLVLSFITFATYAADKRKAVKKQYRTKEATLLTMSFFGGALGGILAMYGIRHKNRKWYFVVTNFGGLIIHIAILFLLFSNK